MRFSLAKGVLSVSRYLVGSAVPMTAAALLVSLILVSLTAIATAAGPDVEGPTGANHVPAPAGLRVYIDPSTGLPAVPPEDEFDEMDEQSERASGATSAGPDSSGKAAAQTTTPSLSVGPTGGTMVDLRDRIRVYSTAKIGPDGCATTHCRPESGLSCEKD